MGDQPSDSYNSIQALNLALVEALEADPRSWYSGKMSPTLKAEASSVSAAGCSPDSASTGFARRQFSSRPSLGLPSEHPWQAIVTSRKSC